MAATASFLTTGTAFAAVPTAPDNLLVFPNRDFITIEGYQSHDGEVATIELTRGAQVVGSAQGTVSGGDVAFEVNHPGGVCWGAGTGVNVTPDIVPGDVVTIKFGGTNFGDTTVQSAGFANDPAGVPDADDVPGDQRGGQPNDTLIVKGTIDPANNPPDAANMEQRIVNPDGFRTNLGKRDIRAVPGPLTASPKAGTSTYSSIARRRARPHLQGHLRLHRPGRRRDRARTAAVSACCSGSRSTPRPTGRASPSPRPARSAARASAAAPPDRPGRRRPGRFRLGPPVDRQGLGQGHLDPRDRAARRRGGDRLQRRGDQHRAGANGKPVDSAR